jgi:hypothetical protein
MTMNDKADRIIRIMQKLKEVDCDYETAAERTVRRALTHLSFDALYKLDYLLFTKLTERKN